MHKINEQQKLELNSKLHQSRDLRPRCFLSNREKSRQKSPLTLLSELTTLKDITFQKHSSWIETDIL